MKISVLTENTTCSQNLQCEHGLSLYIETIDNQSILFDTGQSEKFSENALKMGIDLQKTDFAVLSHGHYDHGGGLLKFLTLNQKAPIFIHKDAFGKHYNGNKYIGISPELRKSDRIIFTDGMYTLKKGLTLHTLEKEKLIMPVNPHGLSVQIQNKLYPEDFRHEQHLIIEENGKKILFSGCSHKGIVNIVHHFRPDIMVGGLHFKDILLDEKGLSQLKSYAEKLCAYPTIYYVGHCTGKAQYDYIRPFFGNRISYISTGTVITI